MKLAALISGGKDSIYAAYLASKKHKIVCLIAIKSKNPESYMFHIPNFDLVKQQAETMGIPLVFLETEGIKEEELGDLKKGIEIAKEKYLIDGVVSGAIASNYQKGRIDKICKDLNLESIAPLWHINKEMYLRELLKSFHVIITGIAADGLTQETLGRRLGIKFIEDMNALNVSPIGEGGETESLVLDCPFFKKKIMIDKAEKRMDTKCSGTYIIKAVRLVNK